MLRVLRPGGRVVILEFSMPRAPVVRHFYSWYFTARSLVGRLVSGTPRLFMLPESVGTFSAAGCP